MFFEKVSYIQWEKDVLKKNTDAEKVFYRNLTSEIKFKNTDLIDIYEKIKKPLRATIGSAGYDFFAPIDFTIKPNEMITIPTGIKWNGDLYIGSCISKRRFFLAVYPRSSLGRNYLVREPNVVSIIDSDYYDNKSNEGHIFINIKNEGNKVCHIKKDIAYAQGIIQEYLITTDDNTTKIRTGGFGSTNN